MTSDPILILLWYVLLPLWMLAGLADWLFHRAAGIQHTTGDRESLIHLLMFGQMGAGLLACLFLEINALVFVLLAVLFVLHEATALWDVSYAVKRRRVSPMEQHVHSFLELLPLMAIALLAVRYWPIIQGMFGVGGQAPDWALRWKAEPLPMSYVVPLLLAATVFELLPFGQEYWSGRQARLRRERQAG